MYFLTILWSNVFKNKVPSDQRIASITVFATQGNFKFLCGLKTSSKTELLQRKNVELR